MNASPAGSHATTDESSFFSISISLRGNGFDPEVVEGDDGGDCNGDAAALPEDAVRVIRRFSREDSLSFVVEIVEVLDGEVPAPTLMSPAPAPSGRSIVMLLEAPA
jgi:hypothetical protein